MISFECDYNNGAHPQVMKHLMETNGEQTLTYGFEVYSDRAQEQIRMACQCDCADVSFLLGGTQATATVIDGMLRSYEAVVTIDTGHIAIHEAGAIEASGHKVIALKEQQGKLSAEALRDYMEWFTRDESRDHLAQPGMVYISFPTEYGTLYSAEEIDRIYTTCQTYGLQLFIDGARMGYGLAASADVTLPWLARHCDAFYIGGTKVGALCGEAVVFPRGNAPRCFFSIVKQHGALLAKGRLTGVQFDALFSVATADPSSPSGIGSPSSHPADSVGSRPHDEGELLYLSISRHAIDMAMQLKALLLQKGFRLYIDSPTNQQFVIIDNQRVRELEQQVLFTHWGPYDAGHTICRFVTSWATAENDLATLRSILG